MADPLDDQAQTRLAVAALFAALAQTLREQDESFPSRFEENVEGIFRQRREGVFAGYAPKLFLPGDRASAA